MKTKILSLIAAMSATCALAGPTLQVVNIEKKNGTVEKFGVEDIKSMSFLPGSNDANIKSVDLGLTVNWAEVNMDLSQPNKCATAPEAAGGYYGWGDPTGQHQEQPETDKITPYEGDKEICLSYYGGMIPLKDICGTEYDIAHVQWGGGWRMPSRAEQDELRLNCTWTKETRGTMNGYKVTGPSGNSIFLPAGGFRLGKDVYFTGNWMGYYWSGTLNPNQGFSQYAYSLDFSDEYYEWFSDSRYYGQGVRPVSEKKGVIIEKNNGEKITIPADEIARITVDEFTISEDHYEAVDLGLSVMWAAVNVDLDEYDYASPSPEVAGGYYGWGDPTGTNHSEDENDYPKYSDVTSISGTDLDLIHTHWGGSWRLPTMEEAQELRKCTWTWVDTYKGKAQAGYIVTGPNGNSIFLPAVGWRTGELLKNVGTHGYYWTGTNCSAYYCYQIGFNNKYFWEMTYRNNGFQLRGVRPKKTVLKGDVNNDGTVDVTDANIIINIVLGKDNAANYDGRADLTGENDVDVSDLNSLLNIILGLN